MLALDCFGFDAFCAKGAGRKSNLRLRLPSLLTSPCDPKSNKRKAFREGEHACWVRLNDNSIRNYQ